MDRRKNRQKDEKGKFISSDKLDPRPLVVKVEFSTREWVEAKGSPTELIRNLINLAKLAEEKGIDLQELVTKGSQ